MESSEKADPNLPELFQSGETLEPVFPPPEESLRSPSNFHHNKRSNSRIRWARKSIVLLIELLVEPNRSDTEPAFNSIERVDGLNEFGRRESRKV